MEVRLLIWFWIWTDADQVHFALAQSCLGYSTTPENVDSPRSCSFSVSIKRAKRTRWPIFFWKLWFPIFSKVRKFCRTFAYAILQWRDEELTSKFQVQSDLCTGHLIVSPAGIITRITLCGILNSKCAHFWVLAITVATSTVFCRSNAIINVKLYPIGLAIVTISKMLSWSFAGTNDCHVEANRQDLFIRELKSVNCQRRSTIMSCEQLEHPQLVEWVYATWLCISASIIPGAFQNIAKQQCYNSKTIGLHVF